MIRVPHDHTIIAYLSTDSGRILQVFSGGESMKWVSHEIVTGMAVYTMTGEPVLTVCAMAGAVLPDWIEGKGGGMRLPWAGWLAHRGWSHWPLLYVLVFLALGVWGDETGEAADLARVGRFIAVGALCRSCIRRGRSACVSFASALSASISSRSSSFSPSMPSGVCSYGKARHLSDKFILSPPKARRKVTPWRGSSTG